MKLDKSSCQVTIRRGADIKKVVDDFYAKNGSGSTARNDDVFFLGWTNIQLIGAVRFCVENSHPMLRSMMVDRNFRGQGVGTTLLRAFESYLDENRIGETHCLPYRHLEKFYGQIGFEKVLKNEIPQFLIDRLADYLAAGNENICMRRRT